MGKTEDLVGSLTSQIDEGVLQPGMRLPSLRATAEIHGVSKNTVVEAYDRLVARQLIQSRPGAGFFVSGPIAPSERSAREAPLTEASDMISLLRAQLTQDFSVRVGDGRPPASWMKDALPKRLAIDSLFSADHDPSGYGDTYGHSELRALIAGQYQARGIRVSPENIVTTFGANHALDMVIRRYLSAGDTVLVDQPGYYPLFAKLKLARVNIVGVRRLEFGPDLDDLQDKCARCDPKLFFTQSTAQNPTGSSMDLATIHGVLKIADRWGFHVVDDDPFVDLSDKDTARLALLDQFETVIGIGTYSKLLSASFRTGYIVANSKVADELAEFKLITTVNSARLSEILITDMIRSGRFQKHVRQLATRLAAAKTSCLAKFRSMGLQTHGSTPAGYYTLLYLTSNMTALECAAKAARKGIFIAPNTFFTLSSDAMPEAIRINFSRADDARFFRFIRDEIEER